MAKVEELISTKDVAARVEALAKEIVADWPIADESGDRVVNMVAMLKGAFIFAADLARALSRQGAEVNIDFMTVKSYGKSTESSRKVKQVGPPPEDLDGRTVLLVDDILDTGHSLTYAQELLLATGAKAIKSCVLLNKQERREADIAADYVGFEIPNAFIVGYGLDYASRYRELPFVAKVLET
ncbi:MAG: hypoxanthine phosphoribosyltransferase [Magnetospiraceae bacterium]